MRVGTCRVSIVCGLMVLGTFSAAADAYRCRVQHNVWSRADGKGTVVRVTDAFLVTKSGEEVVKTFEVGPRTATAAVDVRYAYDKKSEEHPFSVRARLRLSRGALPDWFVPAEVAEAEVPFAARWRELTVTKYADLEDGTTLVVSLVCKQ